MRDKIKLRSKNNKLYNSNISKNQNIENSLNNKYNLEIIDDTLIQSIVKTQTSRTKNLKSSKYEINKPENKILNNSILYEKIPKSSLELIFKKYPPLKDGKLITLRPPYENDGHIIYYGEWDPNTNKRHGRGIQIWPEGSRYEGLWQNDKANIKGKLEHNDGDYYEGEWKDDKAEGYGVYYHIDGGRYEGMWKDDKQSGKGVESWPGGSKYVGNYDNGFKSGDGRFEWSDGSVYVGKFERNNINGKGVYIWKDKRKYDGDWVDNKMEGNGVFNWPDGRVYKGEYINDKKEGYGEFEWSDGRKYYGFWKDGRQNGKGKFFNPKTNEWKEGLWEKGKRIEWIEN